jgi:hypothetical protein
MTGERAGLSPRVGVAKPLRGKEEFEKLREWSGRGFDTGKCAASCRSVDVGWKTDAAVSLGSSAIAGVLPSPSAWLRFIADVAELGTRLMIGLIPEVLPVFVLNMLESESFDIGVGGIDLWSSLRVKAWSTTERNPCSLGGDTTGT